MRSHPFHPFTAAAEGARWRSATSNVGRIERPTDPLEEVGVLLVVGVGDGGEEGDVAHGTPDVIGRAGPLAVEADGELQPGIGMDQLLDDHLVLPAVTEVVVEGEGVEIVQGLEDGDGLLVDLLVVEVVIVIVLHAVRRVAHPEGVEVGIVPAHGGDEHLAELGQPHLSRAPAAGARPPGRHRLSWIRTRRALEVPGWGRLGGMPPNLGPPGDWPGGRPGRRPGLKSGLESGADPGPAGIIGAGGGRLSLASHLGI